MRRENSAFTFTGTLRPDLMPWKAQRLSENDSTTLVDCTTSDHDQLQANTDDNLSRHELSKASSQASPFGTNSSPTIIRPSSEIEAQLLAQLPSRTRTSSPSSILANPPPRRTKIVTEGHFALEEFNESAYEEWESGDEDVIRPYQYEDADSETAQSVKSSGGRSKSDLDPRILEGLRDLDCGTQEEEHEAWVRAERARKKWKRRSSGTKRTLTQSIGSDTDDEDLQPVMFEGANEAGSSARRLRRKVGERTSLIFDDPPSRIEEVDEGCEEAVEINDDEEEIDRRTMRELPYFLDMEIDLDEE
jgi:hypothetical protein